MKKYIYTVGTAALALAMSGVSTALVHAKEVYLDVLKVPVL